MLRVLRVMSVLNRGGAETVAMNIYRNIDRTKFQFDFIVHGNEIGIYEDEVEKLGGKIYRVPWYTGKNHFEYKKAWEIFFKEHPDYKIIHGHKRSTAAIYLKIAKKHGLVTIAHSHSTSSGYGFSSVVKNIMQYPIRNIADYFIACSQNAGEWLFGKKICSQENFFVFKNGIDSENFRFNLETRDKIREELNITKKFVIGNVGNFTVPKNHKFLLNSFALVCAKQVDAVLLLVGDGELRTQIEDLADELKVKDKVIFTGAKNNVNDYLQAMDLFAFPSLWEGFPSALTEAQANGLVCFASDTITKEVFITANCIPLSIRDKQVWVDKILTYIDNPTDRDFNIFFKIKEAGYDAVETAKRFENFYKNCDKR